MNTKKRRFVYTYVRAYFPKINYTLIVNRITLHVHKLILNSNDFRTNN